MNLRTTIVLLVLIGLLAATWLVGPWVGRKVGLVRKPLDPAGAGSPTVLENELTRGTIQRIEVENGPEPVVLERGAGGDFTLPGKWATRKREADELVGLITDLRSRFYVLPLTAQTDEELQQYGLNQDAKPMTVNVKLTDKEVRLRFGEPPEVQGSPFARPTYVRIDNRPEVVRLGPDLLTILRRPREYYQRRQLFPYVERVRIASGAPSSPFGPPTAESATVQLPKVKAITIESFSGKVKIERVGELPAATGTAALPKIEPQQLADAWMITEPVKDRVEPEKAKLLLSAIPELWVEDFKQLDAASMLAKEILESPDAGLKSFEEWVEAAAAGKADDWLMQRTGLDHSERTLRVKLANDDTVVLQIGKVSQTKERTGTPPPPNPMMPVPPPPPIIREDYHYAKLEGQSQVFEIRGDKFNDLFVAAATLRDEKLARFKAGDVQQVEIKQPGRSVKVFGIDIKQPATTIVLAKEKEGGLDRWRVTQPMQALAENDKVSELVDKLAGLEARDRDVIDNADLKATGFEPATGIRIDLAIEEEIPGSPEPKAGKKKPTRKRTVLFTFGKHDSLSKKLHVRVAGRERVNLVDESALKLAERPALAYRGRRVLDFSASEIASIEIKRTSETYRLQQSDGDWKLIAPVTAPADKLKAGNLADDLSRLEAVEYVNDAPKPDDLANAGLDKPALTAIVQFTDPKRKPQSVLIGKERDGKQEYFAKLADSNSIFAVKKETRDKLDVSSLDYRPAELWTATADAVQAVKIKRAEGTYDLKKEGIDWKIAGPFDAPASLFLVQPLIDALANPKLAGYQVHKADKPAEFGLDKPLLEVTLTIMEKGKEGEPEKPRERTLQFGKAVDGKPEVYAKLADDPAVFRLPEATKINADKGALELLDRQLLAVDTRRASKLQRTGMAALSVAKAGMDWKVEAGSTSFPADKPTIDGMLRMWQSLQADRFVAYGAKAELAKYGLNPPVDTLTLTLDAPDSGGKPTSHVLRLGKPVEAGRNDRYAMVEGQAGVAVLTAGVVTELARSMLDFADKSLFKFDALDLRTIRRQMPNNDLEITREGGWRIAQPTSQPADEPTMDVLAGQLAGLRAERVADYETKDLKKYGLDAPAATITLVLPEKDGKPVQHVLKIGLPVDPKAPDGDRFVRVDESKVIAVLAKAAVKRLLDPPLKYRNRNLITRMPEPDRAVLERGDRAGANQAVFSRVEGTWKLTAPLAAEAEHTDMEDYLNSIYKLRAYELVAEKPADLKPYGLDKPEAVWRFYDGEKEVLGLLLGKKDSTDQRCYAKLANGDLVFLLEPKLTQQALAEYRKRTLWTGFDAAQVDTLTIIGEGSPLVLRKIAGSWQIDGKPDAKVNQDAVTDTVAAFSNLKVERYVRDKDAPLDLFGLAKPRRTIVAQTSMGARQEIRLGNFEGGSKRAYANLPAKSEVFVLSDTDAAKLDRDAKAFLAK